MKENKKKSQLQPVMCDRVETARLVYALCQEADDLLNGHCLNICEQFRCNIPMRELHLIEGLSFLISAQDNMVHYLEADPQKSSYLKGIHRTVERLIAKEGGEK